MVFSKINLPQEILRAVDAMGYVEMTEVQEKAMPPMLEGKDVIAKAPTGTGKTCAFGIPLLVGIDLTLEKAQALVLAPTRELARQITDDLRQLSQFLPQVRIACLYGGQAIRKQFDQLSKNPQIIIATPGRLLDHMQRRTVNLREVTKVVLDEADEMLNMGFYRDVKDILDSLKKMNQLGMFSATISRQVMDIGWLYQRDAVEITVQPVKHSMPKITQYSILTTGRQKPFDIQDLIQGQGYDRVMVFCNTKYNTDMLKGQLQGLGLDADCLNGDMTQVDRNRVMKSFKEGALRILVSTDVAARGIDVDDVDAVINYDVPEQNEFYIHRIGRTGRAKKEGVSYILYMPDEEQRLRQLLRMTRSKVTPMCFDGERRLVPVVEEAESE